MNELSLFSGAGGGLLASRMLGWTTIGYVEFNDYCQRIIAQRIKDGWLDEAPIFGDINAFIDQGYADAYQGMVDVLSAGFPCTPFSVAGKQAAADDPRNMWPATIECIRRVRPRKVFLENVPGLLAGSHGYFGQILGELAESGYDARWKIVSAGEVGAPHLRNRLWIVADTYRPRLERRERCAVSRLQSINDIFTQQLRWKDWPNNVSGPYIHGTNARVAHRVDRLKAIGNGQVPQCAVMAYNLLR